MNLIKMDGEAFLSQVPETLGYEIYDKLKYLNPSEAARETHYFCEMNGHMAGVLSVQVNPYDSGTLWMKHVVVDPDFRRQGVAGFLVKQAWSQIRKDFPGVSVLESSSFTDEGRAYLKPLFEAHKPLLQGIELRYSVFDADDADFSF